MNNILKAWNAGFVRRWHTNPHLCDTIDYDSGHQQRCTIMLILFWPDSTTQSILHTLIHDQGECDAGDWPYPLKKLHPELNEVIELMERNSIQAQGFAPIQILPVEEQRRKFVDLLDSYCWMIRHKPYLRHREDWIIQRHHLEQESVRLNIAFAFDEFIDELVRAYT